MKKISLGLSIFGLLIVGLLFNLNVAQAVTPTLSLSNTGEGDNVQIVVNGDANSSVILGYQKSTGGNFLSSLGTTNSSGSYTTTVSTATYGILPGSPVYVKINNQQSSSVAWSYTLTTSSGAITLSKTGLVMTVGQSVGLTVSNLGNNLLYLLSNSNPQIANVNLSGNQLTVMANTYGQTVFTVCVLGTTSNCASAYITVQNSGAQALTFSQSNLTVAYNQSANVTILNGTTNSSNNLYSVLNNSNPGIISASISGSIVSLTANNNSGTATITVCSTDMSSCGIISATAGTLSSTGLTFSQTAPNMLIGQTLSIAIAGGTNLNISSNSNSNIVSANINNSNNSLNLVANSTGSSVITVCSAAGNCNSLTVTVSYVSTGGPLTLSQNNLWLQVGQSVSVTVSGGTLPYSVLDGTNDNFQTSLKNNILTLTGIKAGTASVNVCSAGGACMPLSVLVNGVTTSNQLTFSNNNLAMVAGNNTAVTLFGAGGYYVSNSNNQNVATIVVSGDKVNISALSAGSASATICQTGGQCGVIYVVVTSNEAAATPLVFSVGNPTITVGQIMNIAINGGVNSNYYISSNSNSTLVQANLANKILTIQGQNLGSSVIVVCAATNNCSSLAVTVALSTATTSSTNSNNGSNNTGNSGTNNNSNANNEISNKISGESQIIANGNINSILSSLNIVRNTKLEASDKTKYLNPLIKGLKLTTAQINNLNYFITYGTPSSVSLGVSERASILASYLLAYKTLPTNVTQWSDLYSMIYCLVPATKSASAEAQAKLEFKKIYSRNANLNNVYDNGMIMITAYGLRPARNLSAEKKAIIKFKSVYRHAPISTLAWNVVRAIAYSGVTK